MPYQFALNLCGFLCAECHEPLAFVDVLLVAPRRETDLIVAAVAEAKNTITILDPEAFASLQDRVIAKGSTDAEGQLVINIEDERYQGGAFELVLAISAVPQQKRQQSQDLLPVSLTTLQPQWQQKEGFFSDGWRYCLPAKIWCAIRARFGAWVICGRVVDQDSGVGLAGAIVEAFDTDLFQDDALGLSQPSGPDGHFRIDYAAADFQRTTFSPLINVEFFPGPDLYFRVSAAGGGVLLQEDRSLGRSPGRGNVAPCACVELKLPSRGVPQQADPTTFPYWTAIGDFNLASHINPLTGRTSAIPPFTGHRNNLAFYNNLELRGVVPWREPGNPAGRLKYRFLVQELVPGAIAQPVTGALLHGVQVGTQPINWKLLGNTLSSEQAPIYLADVDQDPAVPSAATPGPWGDVPPCFVKVDAQGWVVVSEFAIGGGFGVAGSIMGLATAAIAPAGTPANVSAGAAVPPAQQLNGRFFRLIFEVARTDGTPLPTYGRTLARLHVSNHEEVSELGIAELGASGVGCSPLNKSLTVKHTVDHELLDFWSIDVSSAAFPPLGVYPPAPPSPPFPNILSGTAPRGGNGTTPIDISSWLPCSYTVSLTTRRALTDGLNDDSGRTKPITFCIDR
jgi:hypothetical protein